MAACPMQRVAREEGEVRNIPHYGVEVIPIFEIELPQVLIDLFRIINVMPYFKTTRPILVISILLAITSCNSNQTTKIEREDEPTIYSVSDNDQEMNKAIETANQTLDQFDNALNSNNPAFVYFSLKTRFTTTAGGEHIWIGNISLIDNKYYGVVENLPDKTTEVNIGDTVQILKDNISD